MLPTSSGECVTPRQGAAFAINQVKQPRVSRGVNLEAVFHRPFRGSRAKRTLFGDDRADCHPVVHDRQSRSLAREGVRLVPVALKGIEVDELARGQLLAPAGALESGTQLRGTGGRTTPYYRGDLRTGLGAWSVEDLQAFLKSGHNERGVAFGSMLDVVNNSTPYLSDDDVKAMAVFLKSLPAAADQTPFAYNDKSQQGSEPQNPGAAIYSGSCAACHGADGKGQPPFMPPLAGNPAVLDPNASSLINLVLNGAEPLVVKGVPDAYRMPQFRVQLTDAQIADVLSYVRGAWGNNTGAVTADQVKKLRPVTDPSSDQVIVLKMR